jgi:23S rRNA pseudouridine2605 synthase
VKFDGSLVHQEKPVYILMNKPEGTISAITDNENRKTVVDILKPYIKARIYPVGRLDFNTTGTLLLTNDGDFANKVMHPKFEVEKRYVAKIKGRISSFSLKKLVTGVRIEDGRIVKALNAGVYKRNDQNDLVFIVIKEGMNHQVKRMLQAVGASVVRLRRESIGLITDKGLNTGQWRYLTPEEIKYLTRG